MNNDVRRIGILAPPGNVAMERELPRYLPPDIVTNHNRLSRPDSSITQESLCAMAQSVDRAAHDLAQAYPEVIVYGCTSGSFLHGVGNEAKVADRITEVTGIAAVTTSTAVVEALQAFNARRLFLVTPYPDDVNAHEVEFLNHFGFEVTAVDGFRRPTSEAIRRINSDDVMNLVLASSAALVESDTIFISCTNMLAMDRIEAIEQATGKPVVNSNQASLWAALCRMKVSAADVAPGRLFARGSAYRTAA